MMMMMILPSNNMIYVDEVDKYYGEGSQSNPFHHDDYLFLSGSIHYISSRTASLNGESFLCRKENDVRFFHMICMAFQLLVIVRLSKTLNLYCL
jgi:hypothetical protein